MEINTLHIELEAWAAKKGWKYVVELITRHQQGDLLETLDDVVDGDEFARRVHNNKQRIQRAFDGTSKKHQLHAALLAPAVRAAIDAERAEQKDEQHMVATLIRENSDVAGAVLTGAPAAVIQKEAIELINHAAMMAGLVVQFVHAGQQLL
ncbi:hypothetical protein [Buttiauxella gaviniae]|uniref:hypothetical protein n=1 Tax=Buttiauxella gaviniae TaxID=82990 RepID=UPI0039769C93